MQYRRIHHPESRLTNSMGKCYVCGSKTKLLFSYQEPVKGEVAIYGHQAFPRFIFRCTTCDHCQEIVTEKTEQLYEGRYSHATYGDLIEINKKFLAIRNLPKEKSDNIGRVEKLSNWVLKHSDKRKHLSKKLLDVGCGLSVFPIAMQELGWQISVLDLDDAFVNHAKSLGLDAWKCEVEHFHLNDFDVLSLNKVIEHVADPRVLLAQCATLLHSDGFLYVEVPNMASFKLGKEREEFLSGHIHVFSKNSIVKVCNDLRLTTLEIEELIEPSGKYTIRLLLSRV